MSFAFSRRDEDVVKAVREGHEQGVIMFAAACPNGYYLRLCFGHLSRFSNLFHAHAGPAYLEGGVEAHRD